ncbi:MAG: glycosyltransferase family 2 protein [Bacteroidetes bacterium]|nr:glycosyltransferase family 2 protein [Bacteroidota bacterium]
MEPTTSHSLSLIIPAYNEETNIKESVQTNIDVLRESNIEHEIVIIDDGSKDRTRQIIEENFSEVTAVIFHSKENGGFGSALKKGIQLSTKSYVFFVAVDSPLTKDVLDAFVSNIGKADILVSHRVDRKGYTHRMKLNSKLYHFLISLLFGLSLKDYNWIQLYNRKLFDEISIENEYIFMLAEVLIKAKRRNFSFFEFPVEMQARKGGSQTAASLKAAIRTFFDLFSFYFKGLFKKQ